MCPILRKGVLKQKVLSKMVYTNIATSLLKKRFSKKKLALILTYKQEKEGFTVIPFFKSVFCHGDLVGKVLN
jgi:hypothetical protein